MLEKHERMHFPELTRQGIWGAGKWIKNINFININIKNITVLFESACQSIFFLKNYKLFDLQLLSIQWSYCEIRIILSPKFGGSFRISVFGKKTQWSLESGRCVLPRLDLCF